MVTGLIISIAQLRPGPRPLPRTSSSELCMLPAPAGVAAWLYSGTHIKWQKQGKVLCRSLLKSQEIFPQKPLPAILFRSFG